MEPVKCRGHRMTPKGTRARRRRLRLKSFGRKSPTKAWSEPATKAAPSGKQTLWWRGRMKQAASRTGRVVGSARRASVSRTRARRLAPTTNSFAPALGTPKHCKGQKAKCAEPEDFRGHLRRRPVQCKTDGEEVFTHKPSGGVRCSYIWIRRRRSASVNFRFRPSAQGGQPAADSLGNREILADSLQSRLHLRNRDTVARGQQVVVTR